MKMNLPQFFIVGAPKAGTTTLYHWLRQNPKIFMPDNKEPAYFCHFGKNCGRLTSLQPTPVFSREEYVSLFLPAPREAKAGEASTGYLSWPVAAKSIKDFNANAKIIIVLRHPVYRAYSEHWHLIRDAHETQTFEASLALEGERKATHWPPLFWHIQRSLYAASVERYFETFGRSHVKVYLYDDLQTHAEAFFESVQKFIGVPPIRIPNSDRHNRSFDIRNRWLQRSVVHPAPRLKRWANRVLPDGVRNGLRQFLLQANQKAYPPLSNNLVQELMDKHFRQDVLDLQKLIGRDLSHWLSIHRAGLLHGTGLEVDTFGNVRTASKTYHTPHSP